MLSMQHRLLPRGNRTERASSDSGAGACIRVCTVSVDSRSDDKRHSLTVMPSCKRKEEGKIRHTDHIGYGRPAGCMLFRSDRGFTQRALQHSLSHAQQQHVRGAGGPGFILIHAVQGECWGSHATSDRRMQQ